MSSAIKPKYSNFKIQGAVLKEASKDWKFYTIGIMAMFAGVQMALTTPILIRLIIDEVIVDRDASNLYLYGFGIIGVSILGGVFNYFNRYFNDKASEETIFRLRNKIFSKIQSQSLRYIYSQETGQLITRAINDLNVIKQYLRRQFRLGLDAIYYLVSIVVIIAVTYPQFLLVIAAIFPFLAVISWVYAKKSRPLFRERREYFGDLSSQIQENINGIETIRNFHTQEYELREFDEKSKGYLNLYIKAEIVRQLTLPIAVLIVSLAGVGVFLIGGTTLINSPSNTTLTLGILIQMNLYLAQLTTPTRLFGNFLVGYTQVNVSGNRVFEILWAENEIQEAEDALHPETIEGSIDFHDVSFSYDENRQILRNISLHVPARSTLAIFGATGGGKSTLINLIPRFFDPTSGEIMIDNIPVSKFKLEPLRKTVATVSQDIFLFSRSIKDNISFGNPDSTDDEIIQAAKTAQIHEFIDALPESYDTIIGERGITLSGGQQQRLTLARAILMNPKILILDDTTSSVDAETEFEIQEAINEFTNGQTTIIITHKVSSARFADNIILMEHGEIVEAGTHQVLLQQGGLYSQIYRTQKDQELEVELLQKKEGSD